MMWAPGMAMAMLGLLATAAAPAAQDEAPGSSRAMVMIRVRPESPSGSDAAIARDQQTQLALLTSQAVIRAALERPEVATLVNDQPDPIAFIQKRLRADFSGEILRLTMTAGAPVSQATLLDAIADAYTEMAFADLTTRREQFARDRDDLRKRVENLRSREQSLRESLDPADDPELRERERPHLLERIHECERQLLALRLREAEWEIGNAQEFPPEKARELFVRQREILGEEIQHLRDRLSRSQAQAAALADLRDQLRRERERLTRAEVEDDALARAAGTGRITIIQRATSTLGR